MRWGKQYRHNRVKQLCDLYDAHRDLFSPADRQELIEWLREHRDNPQAVWNRLSQTQTKVNDHLAAEAHDEETRRQAEEEDALAHAAE